MLLTERNKLASRYNLCEQLVEWIRLDDVGVVAHERPGQGVAVREFLIEFSGEIIFGCDLLPGKTEDSGIPSAE